MLQIADKIVFNYKIAFIDIDHRGQEIHVLDDRSIAVMHDTPIAAVTDSVNSL